MTLLRDLVSLTKPRINVLNVAMAGVGLALAPGVVDGALAAATLVGTMLLVGSANTLNMYLERDVDGLMARTRNRPLPSKGSRTKLQTRSIRSHRVCSSASAI